MQRMKRYEHPAPQSSALKCAGLALTALVLAGCSGDDEGPAPVSATESSTSADPASPSAPLDPTGIVPSSTQAPDGGTGGLAPLGRGGQPSTGGSPSPEGGPSATAGTGGMGTTAGSGGTPAVGGAPQAGGTSLAGAEHTGGSGGSGGGAGNDTDPGFNIDFEYRYDEAAWYDDARKQLLLEAANRWTRYIGSEFDTVPAGTNLRARPPEEMLGESIYLKLDYDIDDIVVMPGSDGDYDGTARFARTGVSATTQDVEATLAATLIQRYQETPAQPWIATLTFDPTYPWFLDPTPDDASDIPGDMADFLSVAMHELGHALGLGTLPAFDALIEDQMFMGQKAMEIYGGPVPMSEDGHMMKDLTYEGEYPIMESGTALGQRKVITALDLAMLEDIGYVVLWDNL